MTKDNRDLTYAELVCLDDFDPYGAETTSDLQNYTQDIYHRLQQARDSNPDNPHAGASLELILSSTRTPKQIRAVIINEVRQDTRTINATCTVTQAEDGSMIANLELETNAGALKLGLALSTTGVKLVT